MDVIDDETTEMTPDAPDMDESTPIEQLPDGIYLHLDEREYHGQNRLSSSYTGKLLISEGDFWASSWMNPNKEDKDTPARKMGRAYHTARLEPGKIDERFIRDLDQQDMPDDALMIDRDVVNAIKGMLPKKEDHPDAVFTDTDVKKRLAELGQPQTQKGESAEDRKARLRQASASTLFWEDIIAEWEAEHGPVKGPEGESAFDRALRLESYGYEGKIWILERDRFVKSLDGRTPIPRTLWDQMVADIEAMKDSPVVERYLTGGLAEVTVLWTEPESGLKLKARIDYLRPDLFTDVKTFDNARGKPYQECIFDAVRYNGYYRQFRFYHNAVEAIRLDMDLAVKDSEDETELAVIEAIRKRHGPIEAAAVFQQKGQVPNLYGCPVRIKKTHASVQASLTGDAEADAIMQQKYQDWSLFAIKAQAEIEQAFMLYQKCMAHYGVDQPWEPIEPFFDIDDNSFNGFWLDPDYQTEDITL